MKLQRSIVHLIMHMELEGFLPGGLCQTRNWSLKSKFFRFNNCILPCALLDGMTYDVYGIIDVGVKHRHHTLFYYCFCEEVH